MKQISIKDKKFNLFIPYEQIICSIKDVATRIKADYADKEAPVFICVLNGSFMFASELIQELEMECELSFIKVASYQKDQSTGDVQNLIGLNNDLEGRHVIIVEDIVDTGRSISHIHKILSQQNTKSIEVATLFLKPEVYNKSIDIKYVAREIGEEFIVGFGLDYDQFGRNYKDIYIVADE